MDSQMSFAEDTLGDISERGLLKKEPGDSENDGDGNDKDVEQVKQRIIQNNLTREDRVKPRRFVIDSTQSEFLNYFEYLVMTLAIWNALWTPLTISFE